MEYNRKLVKKLIRPIHINYISEVFFKNNIEETRSEINKMIEDGLVVESKYGKDYYVLKSN
jgi:hypothetical protein